MLEIAILLLLAAALTGAGLAAWRVSLGPASSPQGLALRISAVAILATALVTFSAWKLSKARTMQLFGGIVPRVETDIRVAALTFDDGPSEQFTEQVLQVLSEQDVKATFFVTGKALAKNPELGQQMVEQGHELGNHSFRHKRMVLKSFGFVKAEIEETDRLIREGGYEGDIHFRSPGGKKLVVLPYYLWRSGRKNIFWDVAPEGYSDTPDDPRRIVEQVLADTCPGSIILLHVMAKNRPASREALLGIILGLREKGYRFVTVSELLALR